MLADSLSKSIAGVTTDRHKRIYMGLDDMTEKHGIGEGKEVKKTKPFKINYDDEIDETENYMICCADIGGSLDE